MGLFNRVNKKLIKQYIAEGNDLRAFHTATKKFFDMGLLREIYSTELVSVCNVANSMYFAFPIATLGEDVCGLVTDVTGIKKIIKDNYYVYEMAFAYINHPKYIVPLNDKFIEVFLPIKEKRSAPGCESEDIDLEFEKRIMKNS